MTQVFTPRIEDWSERVRESFSRQGFMRHLGARLMEVAPGRVVIEADHGAHLTQQHGFFHAGVSGALADSAGGYAGYTLFPAQSSVLTIEYKLNLITPAQGDRLRAVGQVVRSGRTITFCELQVFARRDGQWHACATGQQTLMCLAGRADTPVEGRPPGQGAP
ncbi:MAG: PaaI family thioesterase [Burkholderiaceae bacterium]|nr:PaaI family thioesterase [Burkholderiaceae bacterium]